MHCDCSMQQPRQTALLEIQSKPFNMVTEGVMESVRVNGVTVLSGLNLEWSGSPETKLSTVMRCPSKIFYTVHMLGTLGFTGSEHWAPFNFPQSTALESVRINGVTVLSGLNLEKIQGLSFPMANQTVHSYEMFILGGYPQSRV